MLRLRRYVVLFLAVIAVVSCSPLPAADWCFEFDFRNSNYGFIVHQGSWIPGSGFVSVGSGTNHRLQLTYVNAATVSPNTIIFSVARGSSVQVPTEVRVEAEVFGLALGEALITYVPANVSTVDIPMVGSGSATHLVIDATARAPGRLLRMQVRGLGSNPFSTSNCSTAADETESDMDIGIDIPGQIQDALAEADSMLASVDVDLRAPNGSPLLPALAGATTAFGYIKWIVSGAAASEIVGPFAPILTMLGIFLVVNVTMTAIHFTVYAGIYLVRWAIWLFKLILLIVQTIAMIVSAVPIGKLLTAVGAIISVISQILPGEEE